VDAHVNFYIILAEASRNPILADMYKLFAAQLKTDLLNLYDDTAYFIASKEPLDMLFDGVLRQDAKKAWYWSAKLTGQSTQ